MIRVICATTLILVVLVLSHLAAQDSVPVDREPSDGEATVQPDRTADLKAAQERSDELLQETPVPANDKSLAMIEQELKRTNTIKVRFQGHQVIIPLMDDVPVSEPAAVLLNCFQSQPETTLGKGKHSVIVSPQPATALRVVKSLADVLYIKKGERRWVSNVPTSSLLHSKNPDLKLTKPDQATLEGVLGKAKYISFMLGIRNIIVTMSNDAPKTRIATAIVDLVKQDATVELLDDPEHLIIKAPVAKLDQIVDGVVGILAANVDAPLATPAKPTTPTTNDVGQAAPEGAIEGQAAKAGFVGGGLGTFGGYQPPLPPQAIPSKQYSVTAHIIIAVAEDGKRVWGYSKSLGKWTTLKFEQPLPRHFPVVADNVGFIQELATKENVSQPRHIWAYSGVTGSWDKLTLPAGSKAFPTISNDSIFVEDGSLLQIFSERTGKWSAPPQPDDDPAPATSPKQPPANQPAVAGGIPSLKVFALANMSANEAVSLLRQLFRDPIVRISADARTNALIVMATEDDQRVIEALLLRLDQEPTKAPAKSDRAVFTEQTVEDVAKLKERYEAAERKATEIARRTAGGPSRPAEQRKELEKAVTEAFERRQELHRAELNSFHQRMLKVQHTIQTRDEFKTEIIERRVKDLLNPNLEWNPTGSRPATDNAQSATKVEVPHTDDSSVQVTFTGPAGTTIEHRLEARYYPLVGSAQLETTGHLPFRRNLESGKTHQFVLTRTVESQSLGQAFSLEIPTPSGAAETYLKHNAVPVKFTNSDLDQVQSGNLVVKVVYLVPAQTGAFTKVGPTTEVLVSTRLDPQVDPIAEARRRGQVLVIVRMTQSRDSQQPTATPPQPGSIPLNQAVSQVNDLLKKSELFAGQPPLTDDEVVASIRWATLHGQSEKFDRQDFESLLQIAESRSLPPGWSIILQPIRPADKSIPGTSTTKLIPQDSNSEPILECPTLALTRQGQPDRVAPLHIIRRQPTLRRADNQPIALPEVDPKKAPLFGMPLAAALVEFNAAHHTIAGQKQQPLSELDVIAAIRDWQNHRNDAPVTNEEFDAFQTIADDRYLPARAKFEVLEAFRPNGDQLFHIWSVRILMDRLPPQSRGSTYAFIIRERFIDSKRMDQSEISWGPADSKGFQAGVRLEPHSNTYVKGQKVTPTFYFRNATKLDLQASFPNIITHHHYRKLLVSDDQGNKLNVKPDPGLALPTGYHEMSFDAGTFHEIQGTPIVIGDAPVPENAVVIQATAGQHCRIRFVLDNYADREKTTIETGEVAFVVTELEGDDLALGASGITTNGESSTGLNVE